MNCTPLAVRYKYSLISRRSPTGGIEKNILYSVGIKISANIIPQNKHYMELANNLK